MAGCGAPARNGFVADGARVLGDGELRIGALGKPVLLLPPQISSSSRSSVSP